MKGAIRLGSIRGIEIGVHYNWLLIFFLVAWSLAMGYFPQSYLGWTQLVYWTTGVIASILLFVSVLLHELAHSFVAQARGLPVRSITLFIFGGVSNIVREAENPRTEFAMAVVGPLSSLVIAGVFYGLFLVVPNKLDPLAALLSYLALINAFLAVFNLIPGFPLDGGRVLRSIIWGATGNLVKATNIAATVGRLFGWGLIGVGLFQILRGNFLGGLWIAFIGWFLSNAADSSRQETTVQEYLKGFKVKDVMTPNPQTISPGATVLEVVQGIFRQYHRRAVPVARDGKLVGIVTLTNIRGLPQEKWAITPVEAIMTKAPLQCVSPEDDLARAMAMIAEQDVNQVLVCTDSGLVGIISRADIIRHLQYTQELRMRRKA
jgi:Zn-dependent protease/CBS domain-containing protein